MTGIQAIERAYPTKAMTLGEARRVEFEYIRHGTLSLIASWDVSAGLVLNPLLGKTRNANDFAEHIANTISNDSQAKWIFLVDQRWHPQVRRIGSISARVLRLGC